MTPRVFKWCPEFLILKCRAFFPDAHTHVCIRSPDADIRKPECGSESLFLEFHDLDPAAVRRTQAFANDLAKGREIISRCFKDEHAQAIRQFVADHGGLVVVNCEAGISRSAGVVLALRRYYGGDTEEVFAKAVPNIHVAAVLFRALNQQRV